ncbi:MAG: hypothetical protein IKL10_07290 [Clostridia bacterium]|nr:hypothetical protein [Clostridia bacterium]
MAKKIIKIISVFLCVVLIFQTLEIGVLGANQVYFDMPISESSIETEYTREITVYSGTHSKTVGRAGTFSFNDFTLIPELSFDALNISSNIYPVNIKMNFNSPEHRFLKQVYGINNKVYGAGWLPNFAKFICEVKYSDTREMYLFDGDGYCELFIQTNDISEEEAVLYPDREKWIIKNGISETVIWKLPENSIDYSSSDFIVPEQYIMSEASGELSLFDAYGRFIKKENPEFGISLEVEYVTGENVPPEAISKITDGMGNEFRFTYSDSFKLTKIKAYSSDGAEITAGDGVAAKPLEVSFTYTGDYLTSFVFPDEEVISFAYDNSGNMTSAVNIDLSKIEMEYLGGYIRKVTEKAHDFDNETYVTGDTLTIIRNSELKRTFTDNYGSKEIKTFDASGNILTIVDENGDYLFGAPDTEEETTAEESTEEEEPFISLCPCESCPEYECSCECESEEECTCIQCKRTVYTEYDSFGNVTAEKAFDGTKTLISELSVYSSDGTQLVSSTDSSGNTAYYTYNEAGFLQTVSAGSSSGSAEYDAMGNLLSFSQSVSGLSDGSVMSNSYSYENDKIKSISHNGFTYEFEYDVWGNQTKAKIGNLVLTENTYGTEEHSDRLSSTVFANGQSVSYAYDENDNITSVFYDGEVTPRYSYTYDEEGVLLLSEDNKAGLQTFYTEDGTEIRKLSDNTLVFSSTCDEDGKVTHNIAGNSITYVYDGEYNSVTGVYTNSVSFEKTGSISTGSGTEEYSADAEILTNTDWFGRVTSKSLSVDVETDNGGISVDSGVLLDYADTDTTASTKVTSLTSFVSTADNTVSNQEYYEYDAFGNITGIYRIEDDEKVYYNKYYYDEANQIIREDNRLGEFTSTYTYDVGGNIVSRKRYSYTEGDLTGLNAREVHTYSYEHSLWGDVLTGYNGQPVTYDAMGNITSLEGDTYEWTAGRQLSRIIKGDGGSYFDYFYDDNGQLSSFDMYNEDGTKSGTYQYFWEDTTLIGLRLLEYAVDSSNAETENEIAQLRILYDADGEALGCLVNDTLLLLYTKNILGDITGVINPENGRLLFGYAYDAYGNYKLVTKNNTLGENIAAVFLQLLNPLSYRGYAFTPAVGASHYLGSRFYSPQLCRFMNADVYADTAQGVVGTNMFAYCNNNPIAFVDPNGTNAIEALYKAFSNIISNFTLFVRAYEYCEKYIRDTTPGIIKLPLQRFVGVTYKETGTIVLQYKQSPGNYNQYFDYNLIEHSISEWYTIVYQTLREKYLLLDWVCNVIEKSEDYIPFASLMIQYFKPDWDIMSIYEFLDFLNFLLNEYEYYRLNSKEGDFAYNLFFTPWERYIIYEIGKYQNLSQQNKKLMLLYSIECSRFYKRPFSLNKYDFLDSYTIYPWEDSI